MKLLRDERPSVRNWFIFWSIGFVAFSFVGTLLCVALWLIGKMALALEPPYPAIVRFPLADSLRIASFVSAGFGAYLSTIMMFQWRRNARLQRESAVRIGGFHPSVGPFEHAPCTGTWSAKLTLPTGHPITLTGQGPNPSPAAADLWQRFQERCVELLQVATKDLLRPGNPYDGCPVVILLPWAIRLCSDGRLEVDFEVETEPPDFPAIIEGYGELYPNASFTAALGLASTEW